MTPISTGYIPQFGLGALYQGFNAANADRLNEEEVLKAFLQNQKEQAEAPLNQIIKTWEAKQAQGKIDDPEYLSKVLEGYKGQMNSQIAAGRKGMGTVDSEIDFTNQDNRNKTFMGKVLEDWRNLQLSDPTSNSDPNITTSPIGNIARESDMRASMGTDYKTAPDMPAADYMIKEINGYLSNPRISPKDKVDLLKEKQRLLTELSGKSSVSSNMVSEPQQDQGTQSNLLNKFQNILVNTPEHLQALEKLKVAGANMMNVQGLRNEGAVNAARLRAQQIAKDPKETEVVAHALLVTSGSIPATPEEFAAAQKLLVDRTTMKVIEKSAGQQQGINIAETQKQGQIVNTEPIAQQFLKNPGLLTGDNTRRNTILENKNTGQVSSGNKFKVEKTE